MVLRIDLDPISIMAFYLDALADLKIALEYVEKEGNFDFYNEVYERYWEHFPNCLDVPDHYNGICLIPPDLLYDYWVTAKDTGIEVFDGVGLPYLKYLLDIVREHVDR